MYASQARPVRQNIRKNFLKAAFLLMLPMIFFIRPWSYPNEAIYVDMLEITGAFLIIGGIAGRFWAILYIGAKKNSQLVRIGPYSLCRHPLYLFSTIAVAGFGLMLGVASLAVIFGLLVFTILSLTARKEEHFLRAQFGEDYTAYMSQTPMILPSLKNFKTPKDVEFSTRALFDNARDALGFLLLFPLVEIVEAVQEFLPLAHLALP